MGVKPARELVIGLLGQTAIHLQSHKVQHGRHPPLQEPPTSRVPAHMEAPSAVHWL
jgi:hypothetical protein